MSTEGLSVTQQPEEGPVDIPHVEYACLLRDAGSVADANAQVTETQPESPQPQRSGTSPSSHPSNTHLSPTSTPLPNDEPDELDEFDGFIVRGPIDHAVRGVRSPKPKPKPSRRSKQASRVKRMDRRLS
ncbi:hypothetical protein A0H81_12482 [Grifola frondosa]|uniref:Uncharacterized protein n=1 Tax=Grifola frondosa TaxID=5627 RepID=A0A1C7LSG2_GRIFR|nr:hypothetical protein A0H81_12482 [Grifola frondosa]